jgi:hypothetical protein
MSAASASGSIRPQVVQAELAVGVGEGDEAEPRRLEAGPQRRPVAAVVPVAEQADLREARRLGGGDGGGGITAAVIDDEDLVVVTQAREGVVSLGDGLGQAGLFVVGGQNETEARAVRGSVPFVSGSPGKSGNFAQPPGRCQAEGPRLLAQVRWRITDRLSAQDAACP